ncbi:VirK/YbjX family protein [Rodentibacter caecimuris]|uniref:VirK protein n=1 Tax=Rodentibacter caecimuris TaxID=1796644 RepID=A0ABX3L2D1_9PAST|nr:hypothetical protein BKG89_01805 [Rodentibacter heylii]
MSAQKITFPTFDEMSPDAKNKKFLKHFRERLRYELYTRIYRQSCQKLINFLNQSAFWDQLFKLQQYRFNSLLMTYCDKRFSASQRLQAITENLVLFEQYLGEDFCRKLLSQQSIRLSQLTDNLYLNINLNRIDPFEGYFSINIETEDKQRIYDASFTFIAPNKLLIASIQGPSYDDSQQVVKQATKALHGVRPMFMLVHVFKLLATYWNCELIGIPHKYQGKYRLSSRNDIKFNYDEFWQENEAKLRQGYWRLNTEISRKSLDDIPSKKRSMYRKRYEMFDRLNAEIPVVLNG